DNLLLSGALLAIAFLGLSIGCCIGAMWVETVPMPVTGQSMREAVLKAFSDYETNDEIGLDAHLVDLADATQENWSKVNEHLRSGVQKKGNRLWKAQLALVGALTVCGGIVAKDLWGLF